MRRDLAVAQQLVQAVHAAHEAGKLFAGESDNDISSVVVCQVASENHLRKAHRRALDRGVEAVLFCEPDMDNQATAFATAPLYQGNRRHFSNYPLWKGECRGANHS